MALRPLVVDLAATSRWDPHRILAQVDLALVESLPVVLAASLLFPWGHHHILTWAQEVPLVQAAQCQWEALEDQWEALVDQWEALEDQWEVLGDQWEALEDQWADLVDL